MGKVQLIFVISQPRSGSTLLQSLISNNDAVATASEPWLLLPMLGMNRVDLVDARYNTLWARVALANFKKAIGADFYQEQLRTFLLSLYARLANASTRYVLDKTPRYYEILDEIISLFPECKIIILKRNPFAVLSSIIATWQQESLQQLHAYRRDLLHAPLLLQKFAEQQQGSPQVKVVYYEAVVQQPAQRMQEIYQWLGLEFRSEVLNYSANEKLTGDFGDPKIRQRSMPEPESIHTWRSRLDQPFWGNFFRGYAHFLGSDFLTAYGPYESIGNAPTREFDYYRLLCSKDLPERFFTDYYSGRKVSKNLLRYHYYKWAVGNIRKKYPN